MQEAEPLKQEDIDKFTLPTIDIEKLIQQGFPESILKNLMGVFFKVNLKESL
jgi:hypothetical protein